MPAKRFLLLIALFVWVYTPGLNGKANDFSLSLEKMELPDLPGFQSSAVARVDGRIVVLGGRTDGLHRRQPFASFAPDGGNPSILVIIS